MIVGHDEFIDLLGVYALDAVSEVERGGIEAHLVGCPTCQAEVAEHLEVAGALSARLSAPLPRELWDRIRYDIDAAPSTDDGTMLNLPPLRVLRSPAALANSQNPQGLRDEEPLRRQSKTPNRMSRLGVAAIGLAAAIVAAVLLSGLVAANRRSDDLATQLARPPIELAAERALADPANKRYELASASSDTKATAVVTGSGEGYFVPAKMTALPADRAYQLWDIGAAGPVSLGVMGNNPHTTAFHADGTLALLAVTNEVAGGVPTPQTKPLMTSKG